MGKELLVTNMDELFFKLQRVSFKINNDPEWNFTTCIPFGTPYSAIDGVMPLYDYTSSNNKDGDHFSFFPFFL